MNFRTANSWLIALLAIAFLNQLLTALICTSAIAAIKIQPSLSATATDYEPPDRGVPDRRVGGGTR